MKIALPPCRHHKVLTYQVKTAPSPLKLADIIHRGLCESCFSRVVRFNDERVWSLDKPAGGDKCPHTSTQTIPSKLTKNKPYRNVVCNICGAGLRADNDSNDWRPLREYRFIIEEHP